MLDLLFLRGGIHGNALPRIDVMNDYLDFITVDVSGFSYVLSKLIIHKLGLFYVHAMPAFKASLLELL